MHRLLTRSQLKVRMLRAASGLSLEEFEDQVQLHNLLSIEHGLREPSGEHLAQMAGLLGLTLDDCEEMLRDYEARVARNAASQEGDADPAIDSELDSLQAQRGRPWSRGHAARAERAEAKKSWASLRLLATIEEMALVVRVAREFHTWGIVELLCKESVSGFSTKLKNDWSLDLAELAVAAAERIQAAEGWCHKVRGYAMFYLAAAQHRAGRTEEAALTKASAQQLWDAGWDPDEVLDLVDPIEMIPPPPPLNISFR